ncbi:MAG TPA: CPBP family intramembrane glutamic endopeptidase [Candidatus Saccharimonadales bacterium]|nr:CPBP family intramembrane glutamic endopeptidase [Candidatus Saccharimonadales bacterium]
MSSYIFLPMLFGALIGVGVPLRQLVHSQDILTILLLGFSYVPPTLLLICAVFIPYMRRRGWSLRQLIGLTRYPRWYDPLMTVPAYIVYFVIATALTLAVRIWLPQVNLDQAQDFGIQHPTSALSYVLVFLMLVVIPPLCEELLFRGFLFGTLLKGFPTVVAVLVTSLLFGIAHGQINVFLDTFALSLVLCFLRLKTGSIWAGIGLHTLKNLVAFVLLYVIGIQA